MPLDVPVPQAVASHWQDLLDDCEATAEEYREDGWDSLVIHTGDATALVDEPWGLDVLAPDNEFDRLEAMLDGAGFDHSHVLRTDAGGVRFFGIVVEAPDVTRAVVVPAYLALADADTEDLRDRAVEAGEMYTHVRTLSNDRRVTFSHADPALFFEGIG